MVSGFTPEKLSLHVVTPYWLTRFCYIIGFENIRIRCPHMIVFVVDLFCFHSGEANQKYPDLLPNSPDACQRKPYPRRKSCGIKYGWGPTLLSCLETDKFWKQTNLWCFSFNFISTVSGSGFSSFVPRAQGSSSPVKWGQTQSWHRHWIAMCFLTNIEQKIISHRQFGLVQLVH